jgi:predicted metalloprotease with PDZ domain
VAEGLTSYYTSLLLLRAGLIDEEQWYASLTRTIESVQKRPGRRIRSVSESSFDAWIKHYRPDENTANTVISYYSKGKLVGFLLDAEIRRRSNGRSSLDDALRLAYERYSGDRGFTPREFREVASEAAGDDLDDFFDRFVDGTEELDYASALDTFGLRFQLTAGSDPDADGDGDDGDADGDDDGSDDAGGGGERGGAGWLGLVADGETGDRLVIAEVRRDTPAWKGGLNVEDEILAIEGYRVLADDYEDRLAFFPPGTEAEVLISRRGALRTLRIELGEEPEQSFEIEIDPEASADREAARRAWLEGR